jgi:hypothetical protein
LIPRKGQDFSLLRSLQTGSGAHPTSYAMDIVRLLPLGVKRPGLEADHSPPSSVEIKNDGAIPPLPRILRGIVLN